MDDPRSSGRRALALTAVTLAAAACADAGPDRGSSCPYPSDGPRPVHRVADPGRWLSGAPERSVRETGRLGAPVPEPDTGAALAAAVDATPGDDGRIHVADRGTGLVWTFGPRGDVVRRRGGEGDGPGTFSELMELGWGPADTLRAFDGARLTETVWSPGGELVRTARPPARPGYGPSPEVAYDRRGALYRTGWGPFGASLRAALGDGGRDVARGDVTLDRWSRDGNAWTSLVTVPSVEVFMTELGPRDAAFAPRPLWDAVPAGGLWYADSGEYLLTRISAAGDTLCRVAVDVDPPEVSEEDRKAFLEARDVHRHSYNLKRQTRRLRAGMPIPDRRPVLTELIATSGGGVWARPAPGTWSVVPDTVTWHAFSADGELRARVRLPGDLRPLWAGEGVVLGVEPSELGVDQVVRLEVVRGG